MCLSGLIIMVKVKAALEKSNSRLIGPNCRLTPDFTVFHADGEMQLHEVKAARRGKDGKERYHAEDDAKAKMKAFVDKYEMPLYVVWQERGKTYWTTEVIGG